MALVCGENQCCLHADPVLQEVLRGSCHRLGRWFASRDDAVFYHTVIAVHDMLVPHEAAAGASAPPASPAAASAAAAVSSLLAFVEQYATLMRLEMYSPLSALTAALRLNARRRRATPDRPPLSPLTPRMLRACARVAGYERARFETACKSVFAAYVRRVEGHPLADDAVVASAVARARQLAQAFEPQAARPRAPGARKRKDATTS